MDEYRVEFVTPILKYDDLETLQAIIRKFREIGGVPHASCGIHIHVDGANHTATSLRRLVNFMYSRQEIIYDALAVGSRKNRWCLPVCKNLLDTMKKIRTSQPILSKRSGIAQQTMDIVVVSIISIITPQDIMR